MCALASCSPPMAERQLPRLVAHYSRICILHSALAWERSESDQSSANTPPTGTRTPHVPRQRQRLALQRRDAPPVGRRSQLIQLNRVARRSCSSVLYGRRHDELPADGEHRKRDEGRKFEAPSRREARGTLSARHSHA